MSVVLIEVPTLADAIKSNQKASMIANRDCNNAEIGSEQHKDAPDG